MYLSLGIWVDFCFAFHISYIYFDAYSVPGLMFSVCYWGELNHTHTSLSL